jgi:hypothetical protein
MRRALKSAAFLAAATAAVLAVRLLYGAPRLGYDEAWALLWGSQVAHGALPDFQAAFAPTPHPLTIALGAVLAPLGMEAVDVYAWLGPVSLVALGAATWAAGAALYGRAAGTIAACLLLTSPMLVGESLYASLDVAFLALVLGALALAVRSGRPSRGVFVLLGIAGLLRPEAWLLASAAAAWHVRGSRTLRGIVVPAVAVAAAPVAWALMDLVVTGDPLHSLHGTQDLAAALDRPRDPLRAIGLIPQSLRAVLGGGAIIAGLLGAAAATWRAPRRAVLPLAVSGIGLMTYVGLGLASLPVLVRYLLLSAAVLALLAGYAVTAWASEPPGARGRAALLGAVAVAALGAQAPTAVGALRTLSHTAADLALAQADLRALLGTTAARGPGCGPLFVSAYLAPVVRLATDAHGSSVLVSIAGDSPASAGRFIVPTSVVAATAVRLDGAASGEIPARPAAFVWRSANRSWGIFERCER